MKITTTWLYARRAARNRRKERYDATVDGREGLMARVYPSGAVSFRLRYTAAGKRHVMVLGEFGDDGLSLHDAFEMHRQALSELEKGLDPIEERRKRQEVAQRAREERAGSGTVVTLVEQFVHRKLRGERWDNTLSSWVRDDKAKTKILKRPDAAAILLGYREKSPPGNRKASRKLVPSLVSELGHIKLRDLRKRDLIAFFDSVVDRGAPITANRIYALAKQMFEWAAAKDIIPASPMAGIERPGGDEMPRTRVLTAEEIKAFWSKLDTAAMAEPTKLALRLLLVTAQRRGELTLARWSHFDLDAKLWTVPIELLKSAHARRETPQPHVVPLSTLALDLLGRLRALTGESAYVLPAHASKRNHRSYSGGVLSRAVHQNREHFGIPEWTSHDLRRTAASFMTKIGVPRLHVEKVLNHSTGDIAEVYDRHDYLPQKREALERWSEHLSGILRENLPADERSEAAHPIPSGSENHLPT